APVAAGRVSRQAQGARLAGIQANRLSGKMSMELVTVGTGTVAPSARRTAACHWVSRGDLRVLLDCGAGSLHRLAEVGLPWYQVSHVILTHFPPDHRGARPLRVCALKRTERR